jgi:sugar porter (SP) family MFS transporter
MRSFIERFTPEATLYHNQEGVLELSPYVKGVTVSLHIVGGFLGSVIAGVTGDKLGRKNALKFSVAFYCMAQLLQTLCHNFVLLALARLLTGVAIGKMTILFPLYQSEISPSKIRGTTIALFQLGCTIGILFGNIVNFYCKDLSGDMNWQLPMGIQVIFGVITLACMFPPPKSPRWLASKGRIEDARDVLNRIYSGEGDSKAIDEMVEELVDMSKQVNDSTSYLTLFKPPYLRLILRCVPIQMFQQLTGINFIMFYGISYFQKAGLKNVYMLQILIGLVNCVATLPALYLVERMGRKGLLVAGAAAMVSY